MRCKRNNNYSSFIIHYSFNNKVVIYEDRNGRAGGKIRI